MTWLGWRKPRPTGRARYHGLAWVSLFRCLPLLLTRRPGTPLRVLCIAAFEYLARMRGKIPGRDTRHALACACDLGAILNDHYDQKVFHAWEYRPLRRSLRHLVGDDVISRYLLELRRVERTRPRIGASQADPQPDQVVAYRLRALQIPLTWLWTLAEQRGQPGGRFPRGRFPSGRFPSGGPPEKPAFGRPASGPRDLLPGELSQGGWISGPLSVQGKNQVKMRGAANRGAAIPEVPHRHTGSGWATSPGSVAQNELLPPFEASERDRRLLAGLEALVGLVMLIDDLLDWPGDRAEGIPTFVTAHLCADGRPSLQTWSRVRELADSFRSSLDSAGTAEPALGPLVLAGFFVWLGAIVLLHVQRLR